MFEKMLPNATSLGLGSLLLALALACGKSAPAEDPSTKKDANAARPTCDAIDEACDPYEDKGGLAKECHDLGESKATPEATCLARKADCLAACPKK